MTWWHDDVSLQPGQVRINGKVLTLGANETQVENTGQWGRPRRSRAASLKPSRPRGYQH